MKLPASLQKYWDRATPKQRQMALYGGLLAGACFVVLVFMDTPDDQKIAVGPKQKEVKTLLTDSNTRGLGLDAVASKQIRIDNDIATVNRNLEAMRTQMADFVQSRDTRNKQDMELMRDQIRNELQAEMATQQAAAGVQPGRAAPPLAPQAVDPFGSPVPPPAYLPGGPVGAQTGFEAAPAAPVAPAPSTGPAGTPAPTSNPGIRVIQESSAANPKPPAATPEKAAATTGEMFLPAGSIITGKLVAGIDAPTYKQARQEPLPVLVRMDIEAILPSRRTMNLKDCHLIAAGYGDLSSERAMFRADVMSCIRPDGGAVEINLQAYAVGEDGKNGLRGRVVSKQGAVVARATLAGVAEGFSSFLQKQQVPVISTTSDNGRAQYQSLLSADAATSAAAAGVGKGLDRVAQYYLDLADQMHSVIEIDANRSVDFVLLKGVAFKDIFGDAEERRVAQSP